MGFGSGELGWLIVLGEGCGGDDRGIVRGLGLGRPSDRRWKGGGGMNGCRDQEARGMQRNDRVEMRWDRRKEIWRSGVLL